MKRSASKAERDYMGRVALLGCALCRFLGLGESPASVHHVRVTVGWGRDSHFATIPLCPPHHQHSGQGVHDMGREQFTKLYGVSELELLEMTKRELGVTA